MIEVKRAGEEKKAISEMTTDEILRQQLELLAERSKHCMDNEMPAISEAMLAIVASGVLS